MSKFSDKAITIIKSIAPMVGTAIGGPFGALAGLALSKALGTTKPDGTSDDVATENAVLSGNPQALAQVKQAEMDFQAHMKDLGIAEEKLQYDDMANARGREIAVKDKTPQQLAWLVIGGFMLLSTLTIVGMFVKPDRAELLLKGDAGLFFGTLFGYLISEAKAAAAYYYGSSIGSKDKDATIADIAKSS